MIIVILGAAGFCSLSMGHAIMTAAQNIHSHYMEE